MGGSGEVNVLCNDDLSEFINDEDSDEKDKGIEVEDVNNLDLSYTMEVLLMVYCNQ